MDSSCLLAVRGLIVWAPLCGLRAWTDRASSVRAGRIVLGPCVRGRIVQAPCVRGLIVRAPCAGGLIVLACRAWANRVGTVVWAPCVDGSCLLRACGTDRACSVRAWTDRENSVRGLIVLAPPAVRGRIVWIDTPFYWHRTKKRESN